MKPDMTVSLTASALKTLVNLQLEENAGGADICDLKLDAAYEAGILDEDAPGAFGELSRAFYEATSLDQVVSLVGGYNFYVADVECDLPYLTCCTSNNEMQIISIEVIG